MGSSPYLIVSDIHAHAWNAFSTTNANGMNSRLAIIIEELLRAAEELKIRGGDRMYIAGDVFHTRGSMDPEVFNPLHAALIRIAEMGIYTWIIPGNHDLKGCDTTELGNAIQTFNEISNTRVITEPMIVQKSELDQPGVFMIPWCATKNDLRAKINHLLHEDGLIASAFDLIIHIGIDGVLPGVPPAGLSSTEVASWGFNRVFAGDYHNFKEMEGGKVVSIGATAHQQWGDIGSKAGFVLVYSDRIEHLASHAPNFIELTEDDPEEDYPLIVDRNYVRIRGMKLTDAEINAMRKSLMDMGAAGVTFQVSRQIVTARAGATTKATTLDESVANYIDAIKDIDTAMIVAVKAAATDVLSTIRAVEA